MSQIFKIKRLEGGPLTPQAEALAVAFKIYHGRDEKVHKQKYLMMARVSQLAKAETQAPWPPKTPRTCMPWLQMWS